MQVERIPARKALSGVQRVTCKADGCGKTSHGRCLNDSVKSVRDDIERVKPTHRTFPIIPDQERHDADDEYVENILFAAAEMNEDEKLGSD